MVRYYIYNYNIFYVEMKILKYKNKSYFSVWKLKFYLVQNIQMKSIEMGIITD